MPDIIVNGPDGPEKVHILEAEKDEPMETPSPQNIPQKSRLLPGIVIGLVLGATITGAMLGRYQIISAGPQNTTTLKLDRWTGNAMRYDRASGTWLATQSLGEAIDAAAKN